MIVNGTVISLTLDTTVKKQSGGTYRAWELIYKSSEGDVRTIAKPVQGLAFNGALKEALGTLSAGDNFELDQEKNTGGFYEVKSIVKREAGSNPELPKEAGVTAGAPKTSGATAYQARDFEGKEERTVRQRLIVRQSSLTAAIATLSVGAKSLDKEAVKSLAEELTDFVFETKRGSEAIEEIADDIPY